MKEGYTGFTNLEITGKLHLDGAGANVLVTAAEAVAAAGSAPTKAEFDALVTLANANKVAINAIAALIKQA